jgi:hypothetical protein
VAYDPPLVVQRSDKWRRDVVLMHAWHSIHSIFNLYSRDPKGDVHAANRMSAATPGIQQVVKRRNPDQLNDIMKSRSRYFKDEVVSAQ